MQSDRRLAELDLHLTNRCNCYCKTCCYSSNDLALQEMETEQLLDVVEQAIRLGCAEFHFSGGEPLLRQDLAKLIRGVLERQVDLRLQTNGVLLTRERAKELRDLGLRDIMISLDGHTRETCDAIRGDGSYDAAVAGVVNALDCGFRVRVNAVLTQSNRTSFPDIVELVRTLGVKTCSSFYFSPLGRGAQHPELWITPLDYVSAYNTIQDRLTFCDLRADNMDVIVEKAYATWQEASTMSVQGFTGCGAGCGHVFEKRDYLIVRCDGNVYPCILLIEYPGALGNVHDTSLENIWRESKNWRMLDRTRAVAECGDCEHLALCNGGCAGYARLLSGRYDARDPRCIKGQIVPLCPIMKYNILSKRLGGSSADVLARAEERHSSC